MPSRNYQLFRKAILGRKQVTCIYQGFYRELCPHVLGYKRGQETALTFQFAGESASGLPSKGEWRCLFLAQVHNAQIRSGPWHAGSRHTMTQACVDSVEIDVNG